MEVEDMLENKEVQYQSQLAVVRCLIVNKIKLIIATQDVNDLVFSIPYNVAGHIVKDMASFRVAVMQMLRKERFWTKPVKGSNMIYINWSLKRSEAKQKFVEQLG
jgi:hypothetical protein